MALGSHLHWTIAWGKNATESHIGRTFLGTLGAMKANRTNLVCCVAQRSQGKLTTVTYTGIFISNMSM